MTRDRGPSGRSLPEEIRFFGRSTLFGIGIAIVYWFVIYEVAGTVLLLAFGIGSGVATAFLASQLIKA